MEEGEATISVGVKAVQVGVGYLVGVTQNTFRTVKHFMVKQRDRPNPMEVKSETEEHGIMIVDIRSQETLTRGVMTPKMTNTVPNMTVEMIDTSQIDMDHQRKRKIGMMFVTVIEKETDMVAGTERDTVANMTNIVAEMTNMVAEMISIVHGTNIQTGQVEMNMMIGTDLLDIIEDIEFELKL
uniref:Uncharacterized protein n=1 Tax=Cacopsylla melanoneura TaxID=428564 RepID=A0A8D9BUY5_9HEMI